MSDIRYMLDTDILVFMLRRLKNSAKSNAHRQSARRIRKRIENELKSGNPVGLSMITACELEFGASRTQDPENERSNLYKILAPFDVLDADSTLLPKHYGEIRAQLEREGVPIGATDLLIAAHARSIQATLVTNNVSEFKRVRDLSLENWSE